MPRSMGRRIFMCEFYIPVFFYPLCLSVKARIARGLGRDSSLPTSPPTVRVITTKLKKQSSIVGKGNHSVNNIQKLKPRVEQVCRELGLQYATEDNAGRIYVNLTGGAADMPPPQQQQPPHHYQPSQPHHGGQQQAGQEELVPRLLRKLEQACCIVM